MKAIILSVLLFLEFTVFARAQSDVRVYKDFPIVVSLQFHSLSMPFKNLKSNFSNLGIGIGTEVKYGGNPNWVQRFSVVWYRNRPVGNGLMFNSQAIWRPSIAEDGFGEIKAGLAYLISFRPLESYRRDEKQWRSVGKRGKGMIAVPIGLGLGYSAYTDNLQISSFLNYQLLILTKYNKSIPLLPETLIQTGTRIHYK